MSRAHLTVLPQEVREMGSGGGERGALRSGSMDLFERVFAALNEASARYVVVGGVATVLHGHARLTADVDLVVSIA